jgi:beta-phosphoglucomutase family hydrolase
MSKPNFESVIFDLDGVITTTALVHGHAWKQMFDEYLRDREKRFGEPFREFTHEGDYLPYVDGKPRYDGVKSFLASRGIEIPFGDPSDEPGKETVCGLGNRKNMAFNEVLEREGVQVYDSTVKFMHSLKENDIRIGVASSSKNCYTVLKAAGLLNLIETRVDGVVSAELGLKGKPEPDIFVTACNNLRCNPARSVVVEDAVSGVAAGRKGNFGLVIGIARENNSAELYANGADIVVKDMEEIDIEAISTWFEKGLDDDNWSITYHSYEPAKEKTREALLTVGNGYFGTRGAMEETRAGASHYPGTYVAGLYNRLITPVAGKDIENEDFVNIPNWLPVNFRINDGNWIDIDNCEITYIERKLDFRTGLVTKQLEVRDNLGNETLIVSDRFASMSERHLAAMRYTLIPLNYSGKITIRTGINGAIINAGVDRYKSLNQKHLKQIEQKAEGNLQHLLVETTQSGIKIAVSAVSHFYSDLSPKDYLLDPQTEPGAVYGETTFDVEQGNLYSLVKKVAIYTSKTDDVTDPLAESLKTISQAADFETLLEDSTKAWSTIWEKIDIKITGDRFAQKLIRLHLYHLMVSMSPNNTGIDASITARGLHGEAYRGHIFWDELFILPLYDLQLPEVAKSMLLYRYKRLDQARAYAKEYGYRGAMFPWQSGSDGREETQIIHLNPLNGQWDPDHSSLQRHVSLAIAYNIWQYYSITLDAGFMQQYGAEMFFEICRFWASKAEWNQKTGRYDIRKVMGPDEFHEQYPDAKEGGLTNNAYTNLMAAWMFSKIDTIQEIIGNEEIKRLRDVINLDDEELSHWNDISRKLTIPVSSDGIIAQYEGYFDLKELDWDYYKAKYGNIYRMDRILKSEGLTPDTFKVSKQADALMTFYNLDKKTVDNLLNNLGYSLPQDYLEKNLEYYFKRTSHGSTLSRIVHSKLAALAGNSALSWELYSDALASDYVDIQGGTTAEGIHAGVMAGTILIAVTTYAGIDFGGEILKIKPALPVTWQGIGFGLTFRGVNYHFEVNHGSLFIQTNGNTVVEINGEKHQLLAEKSSTFTLK